jgi:hypothetical protein
MPRRVPRETSRRGVELVDIASPYTGTDRVLRRVDSLAQLRGSGIIGDREMRAAERYRTAYVAVHGSGLPCTLANSLGGAAPTSRTPPLHALQAAAIIKEAALLLGKRDGIVVLMIVAWGFSINHTANKLFAGEIDRKHVGHRLKYALQELAHLWFGPESQRRNHVHRGLDARPQAGDIDEILPDKVAHASRKGVSY